jgi:hypothetical protein
LGSVQLPCQKAFSAHGKDVLLLRNGWRATGWKTDVRSAEHCFGMRFLID